MTVNQTDDRSSRYLIEVETELGVDARRQILIDVLSGPDPTDELWVLCDSGQAKEVVPELSALQLEQDPIHRHKDVLAHTIAVTASGKT